jgi:hypothetical protein
MRPSASWTLNLSRAARTISNGACENVGAKTGRV